MAQPDASGKCGAPTTEHVKSYLRAQRRKKPKSKRAGSGAVYYVVRNERTGRTSGTEHKSLFAATRARKQLDLISYRKGQGRPWNVEKVTR